MDSSRAGTIYEQLEPWEYSRSLRTSSDTKRIWGTNIFKPVAPSHTFWSGYNENKLYIAFETVFCSWLCLPKANSQLRSMISTWTMSGQPKDNVGKHGIPKTDKNLLRDCLTFNWQYIESSNDVLAVVRPPCRPLPLTTTWKNIVKLLSIYPPTKLKVLLLSMNIKNGRMNGPSKYSTWSNLWQSS